MGKYKPWDYIPNQPRYEGSFNASTYDNDTRQFAKLCNHNEKQMRRKRIKKK